MSVTIAQIRAQLSVEISTVQTELDSLREKINVYEASIDEMQLGLQEVHSILAKAEDYKKQLEAGEILSQEDLQIIMDAGDALPLIQQFATQIEAEEENLAALRVQETTLVVELDQLQKEAAALDAEAQKIEQQTAVLARPVSVDKVAERAAVLGPTTSYHPSYVLKAMQLKTSSSGDPSPRSSISSASTVDSTPPSPAQESPREYNLPQAVV